MNILVVGANGLLGRNLVRLLSKKHHVFATVKKHAKLNFKPNKKITVIEIDLLKIDTKVLPSNIDIIFYLAQSSKFKDFLDGSSDMISVNILAVNIIAQWGLNNGVKKFIYTSTGGVYKKTFLPIEESFLIKKEINELDFYISSKISAENILLNYSSLFKTFIILRPFFIYGAGQNQSMLMPRLIKSVKNKKEIIISGVNGIKINPIFVEDAAKISINTINLNGIFFINLAGSETVTIRDLCLRIGQIAGQEPIFKINNIIDSDLVADISIMKKKLGKPKVDLQSGIQSIFKSISKF
jgi:nucleoside-diphosphate-sugar epimerase